MKAFRCVVFASFLRFRTVNKSYEKRGEHAAEETCLHVYSACKVQDQNEISNCLVRILLRFSVSYQSELEYFLEQFYIMYLLLPVFLCID